MRGINEWRFSRTNRQPIAHLYDGPGSVKYPYEENKLQNFYFFNEGCRDDQLGRPYPSLLNHVFLTFLKN